MGNCENMDHSEIELGESVELFLTRLLRLRQRQNLLIYLDGGSDYRLASIIQAHAQKRAGRVEILHLDSGLPLADQVRQLNQKVKRGSFHAICELSEQYFYLTSAWKIACMLGARVFSLAGLDTASFIRCVGKANNERMFQFGMVLKRVLQKSRHLRITTQHGTDIRMQLGLYPLHRLAAAFRRGPRPFILSPSGVLGGKMRATFLGGQLAFRGIPATIEGIAVIDGYLWPPAEIGLLERPIILKIEGGIVVDISGCSAKSKILARRFDGQVLQVEHFCIGFNPGARLSGKILEAERVFGCISVGLGKGLLHTDGVMTSCSMQVDQTIIEQNGSFICEELLSLKPQLLRNDQQIPQVE